MPNQNLLIAVIDRDAKQVKPKLVHSGGKCSGLSIRFLYHAMTGQLDRFKQQMRLLLNNDPSNLNARLQIANDIIVSQAPDLAGLPLFQNNYPMLLSMMAYQDTQKTQVPLDQSFPPPQNVALNYQIERTIHFSFNREQLVKLIKEAVQEGQFIMVSASEHAGAFYLKDGIYYCYEPNISDGSVENMNIIAHDTPEKLVNEMIEKGFFHNFYKGQSDYFTDKGKKFFVGLSFLIDQTQPPKTNINKTTLELLKSCGAWDTFDCKETTLNGNSILKMLLQGPIEFEVIKQLIEEHKLPGINAETLLSDLRFNEDERIYRYLLSRLKSKPSEFLPNLIHMAHESCFTSLATGLKIYIELANTCLEPDANHFFNLIASFLKPNSVLLRKCLEFLEPLSKQAKLENHHNQLNSNVLTLLKKALEQCHPTELKALLSKWPQVHGVLLGTESLNLLQACASGQIIKKISPLTCPEYLEIALHVACVFGHTQAVLTLLDHTKLNNQQIVALFRSGNDQAISELLKNQSVLPKILDALGETSLCQACAECGLMKSLEASQFTDIDKANKAGQTALMLALAHQHYAVALKLLAQSCNVALTDLNGNSALHFCVNGTSNITDVAEIQACKQVIKKLLNPPSELLKLKNSDGNTALHVAAATAHADIVKTLLEHEQADLYTLNNNDDSLMHVAVRADRQDVVDVLIEHEKKSQNGKEIKLPTLRNKEKYLPLHLACSLGDDAMVNRIRRYWAGPKNDAIAGNIHSLPLYHACAQESFALTTALVDQWGEDVNGVASAMNPIIAATIIGNFPILEFLLSKKKASVEWTEHVISHLFLLSAVNAGKLNLLELLLMNLTKPTDESSLDMWYYDLLEALKAAFKRQRYDMIRAIVSYDLVNVTSLLAEAVDTNNPTAVNIFLMSSYYDLSKADVNGNTLLHRACMNLNVDIVLMLCQAQNNKMKQKDIYSIRNKDGKTALAFIDAMLNAEKTKMFGKDYDLIAKCQKIKNALGAVHNPIRPINPRPLAEPKSKRGLSVVHLATVNSDKKALALIIERGGAPMDAQDFRGNTALHIAALLNDTESVKMLIAANASLTIANDAGLTAADLAIRHNNKELFALFNISPLSAALYANDPERVKELLLNGEYKDVTDEEHKKLLVIAKERCVNPIFWMLENAKVSTPMHLAVLFKDDNALQKMLDAGLPAKVYNQKNKLPIQIARETDNKAALKILHNHCPNRIGLNHEPLEIVSVDTFTHTPGQRAIALLSTNLLPNSTSFSNTMTTLRGDHRGLQISFGAEHSNYAEQVADGLISRYGFNYAHAENGTLCIDCPANSSNDIIDEMHREIGIYIYDICNTQFIEWKKNGFSYLRDVYCASGASETGVKLKDQNGIAIKNKAEISAEIAKLQDRFNRVHAEAHADKSKSIFRSALSFLKGEPKKTAVQSTPTSASTTSKPPESPKK